MQSTEQFLRSEFQQFYKSHAVPAPLKIGQREFGIGAFGKKISMRHLAFADSNELNGFLRNEVPFYISYSCAYYKYPEMQPMNAKHFLQADLVYEFDADDLQTECRQEHDSWKCVKCGASGKGTIENCTKCGAHTLKEEWVCSKCLNETKKQSLRLIGFLQDDFDFSEGIEVNYSGSKGFHIHVNNEKALQLSQNARTELIDYLSANGIMQKNLGFDTESKMFSCPLPGKAKGWQKKIIDWILGKMENSDSEELALYGGVSNALAKKLITMRSTIISGISSGMLYQFPGSKAEAFWNSLIASAIDSLKLGIDRQTSIDLHKIIRLPETIHGGTGLMAKKIPLEKLAEFDALRECISFSGDEVKVKAIAEIPEFELNARKFGKFGANEEIKLPEYAAIYLLARNAAQLAE